MTGLFIITFILQAFEIPSSSMENTLLIGDHVFVNRIIFAPVTKWVGPLLKYRNPHHGDIIVFLSPAEPGLYVVKRVIGTPGDRIHLQNGVVYRNGEKLDEPYVIRRAITTPIATTSPAYLPARTIRCQPGMASYLAIARSEWRSGGTARQHLRHG